MKENPLEKYYSKFHEDKRLTRRHGIVEYTTAMKYIHEELQAGSKILDLGAGTGRYSSALCDEGFDVTAVEITKCNFNAIRSLHKNIKAWNKDARDLSFLDGSLFDGILVFGPLYHLQDFASKSQVLTQAKRLLNHNGKIFSAYLMNEYAILSYCFVEGNISSVLQAKKLSPDFHALTNQQDLYSYTRLEDIDALNASAGLIRKKIVAMDGAADYLRPTLNRLSQEDFQHFIDYHLATCERKELLGASSHVMDIVIPQQP